MLGEAYLCRPDWRRDDGVQAAQKLAPGDPASVSGIGIIAMQNQQYDEALGLFNEASR